MIRSTGCCGSGEARFMRTFTSPRSSSNSAMSFSIRNSISSLISFWFMGFQIVYEASPWLNRKQFFCGLGKNLAARFGHHNRIFDAHSELFRQVNAWLDGNHHSGLQEFLLPSRNARSLMNLQAQAVAGGVG